MNRAVVASVLAVVAMVGVTRPAAACTGVVNGPVPLEVASRFVVVGDIVEATLASDLIDRTPRIHKLAVSRIIAGTGIPRTIGIERDDGCSTMYIPVGTRIVAAMSVVEPEHTIVYPEYSEHFNGPTNYNSVFWRLLPGRRITLIVGSAELQEHRPRTLAQLEALLRTMPDTAARAMAPAGAPADIPLLSVLLVAASTGAVAWWRRRATITRDA